MTTSDSAIGGNRWLQLWLGVLSMALIANMQYAWTLFVGPIQARHGWALTDIQWAFSIFIAAETWLTPVFGALVDRMGPRNGPRAAILTGAILVAAGWTLNAFADRLDLLYAGAAVSGTGAGAIYATCVGNAVKWFTDRRGLAVGLTAAGFGAGAALTVIPIKLVIAAFGYASAFLWFGLGQGALLLLIACVLRGPTGPMTAQVQTVSSASRTTESVGSGQMLRSPIFWLLYLMFTAVSASGLMATAQLGPIAHDYGLADTILFMGAGTLSVALVVDNVLNGAARPFFGWVSDRIGREKTMALAFSLGAASYGLLATAGHSPWAFVACAGLIFFTWGEIFSLFPSTCTDTFGPTYATTNASLLYTAKGTSAFLVPLANLLVLRAGGWATVFLAAAGTNTVVVILALFVLRPLRASHMQRPQPAASPAVAG